MSRKHGPDHHVTITVDERSDNTLKRVQILTDALLRVVQGSKLIRVLSADYIEGCIELVLEGPPRCDGIDATVSVEVEPLPGPS